jgi:hypothetical protein
MVGITQRGSFGSLLWQTNQFSLNTIFYLKIYELELEQSFLFDYINIQNIYTRKKN